MDDDELVGAGHMAEDIFVRQMKRLRVAQGLSQAELADRVGELGGSLYQQTIAKIESGQRALRLQEADLIAKALRSSVSEMLAAAIDKAEADPEANPETMDIENLLTRVKAVQRRRDGLAANLHDARRAETEARFALEAAEARAAAAMAEATRAQAHHDEAQAELNYLTRISINRQAEFNRVYGPQWRQKLSNNPPITVEELTRHFEKEPSDPSEDDG
ncbi:helix-turn-helix transcriptional regulator [Streptomyces cylindrosporus]|uniref:Helix-turn-helix domain-containing protein n=1 Tax=Streptomyces cylindrosporus TaxID=2927583 RepID=A0ABS9Y4H2_9ACTN|nr:helix-turn-helix transcriptional regulator [Streptomyces cylindrosporus]MCI3272117.1 helix-turn-helix domain-containing protein [Streptomyces cylindrosporus]